MTHVIARERGTTILIIDFMAASKQALLDLSGNGISIAQCI
jgi:hypothetical protein